MEKILVDDGKEFDFGKTSKLYGQYRDIYPKELYKKLYEIGVGVKGSEWLDLGTGTRVVSRGMAKYGADIIGTDISKNQIEEVVMMLEGNGVNSLLLSVDALFHQETIPLEPCTKVKPFCMLLEKSSRHLNGRA